MRDPAPIASLLAREAGGTWTVEALSASSFTATWRASSRSRSLFVKSVPTAEADLLESEADGLSALSGTGTVRVPAVAASASSDGVAVLALEWLDFAAPDRGFGERLGHALGALHTLRPDQGNGRFGWHRHNRLGATPQPNDWSATGGLEGWIAFLRGPRLGAMRDALVRHGAPQGMAASVDEALDALPDLFDDGHVPRPSLIHGDLWSGNQGMLAGGEPVVFDPAVSVSDAEAELAMMEMFGRPPAGFGEAYGEFMPPQPGYPRRRDLYQLYHLLNHALLFGGGYVGESIATARRIANAG